MDYLRLRGFQVQPNKFYLKTNFCSSVCQEILLVYLSLLSEPILENKDIRAIFQKKGKKIVKKDKVFESLGKNVQNVKKS